MTYKPAAAIITALLTGCATPQERVRTVRVDVPVAVECPRPAMPARPPLPLADVPPDADPADVARAALASLHACTGYAAQLEALLAPEQDSAAGSRQP